MKIVHLNRVHINRVRIKKACDSSYEQPGRARATGLAVLVVSLLSVPAWAADTQQLPSWGVSASRTVIMEFVEATTTPANPEFVKPAERIAVFDNDGTLWAEQPFYFQLVYAIDRVKELAPEHPEWREQMPFKAVLEGDIQAVFAGGTQSLLELVLATHGNMTTTEYARSVSDWLESSRHPVTGKPYTEMVYQPMLELLGYLRANGYKTYIVSGGGIEFMRVFSQAVYGIPPEQVIGSSIKTQYEVRNGVPVITRLPEMNFVDDKEGKPVAINQHIGRRPIIAGGNSDGDFQMLEWATSGQEPSLALLVHHDDAKREWAYDRESAIGKLDRGRSRRRRGDHGKSCLSY
jgi:phosphoglycolate phosphatase-like HAD superfamily hydrolase